MDLGVLGEFGFIERLQRRFSSPPDLDLKSAVSLGIGDDAAAVIPSPNKYSLLTTDSLVEGIHFTRAFSSFHQVGFKALAVNLSDIAAMGGVARFFLVSLGLPKDLSLRDLDQLYRGLAKGMQEFGLALVGGNTSATTGPFFITITLLGEVDKDVMLRRDGAKPGDALFVTGTLGDAAAGLEILKKGLALGGRSSLIRRQLRPKARLREGRLLAEAHIPSAMMDVSDGLTADLTHILKQSGLGAELDLPQIPLSAALKCYVKKYAPEKDPLDYALYGGEDYELLFSVPEKNIQKLEALIQSGEIQACRIGTMCPQKKGLIAKEADGRTRKIHPRGHDHFKSERSCGKNKVASG